MNEFDLIQKYFSPDIWRDDVVTGVGDDCAILQPPLNKQLAVTADTLISGVHFPENTSAEDIAYKAVAVNLSDLAAMGAEPAWLTLALTLPEINTRWLQAFASSFSETAKHFNVQLVGGDTTRGNMSITVQAMGFVEPNKVMRRDKASPGDRIYVSGSLGDAALGLHLSTHAGTVAASISSYCRDRLNRPTPRLALGKAAAEVCTCGIDISDGLIADLGHILAASECGARIELDAVPVSKPLRSYFDTENAGEPDWNWVLAGGDDYELCLLVSETNEQQLIASAHEIALPLTRIGEIHSGTGLQCLDKSGDEISVAASGYLHF